MAEMIKTITLGNIRNGTNSTVLFSNNKPTHNMKVMHKHLTFFEMRYSTQGGW